MCKYIRSVFLPILLAFCLCLSACTEEELALGLKAAKSIYDIVVGIQVSNTEEPVSGAIQETNQEFSEELEWDDLPTFSSERPWVEIHGNIPYFDETNLSRTDPFEIYSDLDSLGRCGVAYANICKELMPTDARGSISSVKPSGWHSVKYDIVDGKYLFNRCHLIGFQLAGENANERNLITGTRYLNIEGMLPFENLVADYVNETGGHVLYRVTPVFIGDNLVADGVLMEGWSVEDEGEGVCFCVFAYNAQPGIAIDYVTGDSWEDATVGKAE